MNVPAGRYVIVQRSLPHWCAVCHGKEAVAVLDPAHPYGPTATVASCPHCDCAANLPIVYLPPRRDVPRRTTS